MKIKFNCLRKQKIAIEELWFNFLGGRYCGNESILLWDPKSGLSIKSHLSRVGKPVLNYSTPNYLPKITLHIKINGYWTVIKSIFIEWPLGIVANNTLDVIVPSIVLTEKTKEDKEDDKYVGTSLYCFPSSYFMLETAKPMVWFKHKTDREYFYGKIIKSGYALFDWEFEKKLYNDRTWYWADSLQDSLSVITGDTFWLLKKEMTFKGVKKIEIRSPLPFHTLSNIAKLKGDGVDKIEECLFQLLKLFIYDSTEAKTARTVFYKMTDADKQGRWSNKELLVSIVLEGLLRPVCNKPFVRSDKSGWGVENGIKAFREKYLPRSWKKACNKAIKVHWDLRHRNAHPDWYFQTNWTMDRKTWENAIDQVTFLSRLYGYMIFAMAGVKGIKPLFPKSHKKIKLKISYNRAT